MLKLSNTLSRKKETFVPLHGKNVGLYTCGPTVYHFAHIGNLRTYIFEDILKRTLIANGYAVNHVMNITDVGHLTDDADAGEDKMEKGARREGKSAWDIAAFYTDAFKKDLMELNILPPDIWCKATDHIQEQIALVAALAQKGHTYETSDGIYFDTTTIDDYGKLAGLKSQRLKAGARVRMGEKKNPHDFALWKFTPNGQIRQMEWNAFGKKGFPGWHIECSAMSLKYLGDQFDIHCGGIDHVSVHHTNEIAQSEAATGRKPWVKYWLHGEFLVLGEEKMAKSGENFITLQTLKEHGISPMAYRYFCLQTHYRKPLTFSWEALTAAQAGIENLYREASKYIPAHYPPPESSGASLTEALMEAVNDDLNTPNALAFVWETLGRIHDPAAITSLLYDADKILGLNIFGAAGKNFREETSIPDDVAALAKKRDTARKEKNWKDSDRLRDEIMAKGFTVEDTPTGSVLKKT